MFGSKKHIDTKTTAGNANNDGGIFFQPKLSINQPGDIYEQEADAMADKVMRMQASHLFLSGKETFFRPSNASLSTGEGRGEAVQRKCAHCEEEKQVQRRESNAVTSDASHAENYINSISGGSELSNNEKSFFEPRMGYDFSDVKIHTDSNAVRSARSINALAYTSGNNIVFNERQFAPGTDDGKKLLAHELTHVIQQKNVPQLQTKRIVQRRVYHGTDHAGTYDIDTDACTMNYNQDWYFNFGRDVIESSRNSYMASAKRQVESVWSHKHPIKPGNASCPCNSSGFDVTVGLNTSTEPRRGRHGYSVDVNDEGSTGLTTQPTRHITLDTTHETPVDMGSGLTQQRIAHEFGHTLGITDEYHWWTRLWHSFGAHDRESIMHSGDEVRPRHYQQFADIINQEIAQCDYHPEGFSSSSLANPVARFGVTTGTLLNNPAFVIGLHVDRRLGNDAFLGMFYPRLGFDTYWNTQTGSVLAGPTVGLSLNRLAHPLFLDVNTGVLFDPGSPGRVPQLNIPASVTLGLRGNGFQAGVNYTGMVDVLNRGAYSHIVGVSLSFDIP